MIFSCIKRMLRNLLSALHIRKKTILVLSNQKSHYATTFDDYRFLSDLKSPEFADPKLCSSFYDLMSEVRKGYDIVHFAVHGNEGSIEVSDNEPRIGHDQIMGLFRGNLYTKLVFFNVCKTDLLAEVVSRDVPAVIGWRKDPCAEDFIPLYQNFYRYHIGSNLSISDSFRKSANDSITCKLFDRNFVNRCSIRSYLTKPGGWLLLFVVAILSLTVLWFLRSSGSPVITSPASNSNIVNPCNVEISAGSLRENANLWIFVCTPGDNERWWPQGKAEKIDGDWRLSINCGEARDTGVFKICAMVVDRNTDSDLDLWIGSQFSETRMEPLDALPAGHFFYKRHIINVRKSD